MFSLSFSFSYAGMIAIVVFLLIIIVSLMYNFKSPMRKWVCFSLSAVSIFYLLYIMLWHEGLGNGQKIDWYLLGCVGVVASLGLAGIGIMDLVKPVTQPELVEEPLVIETSSSENNTEDTPLQFENSPKVETDFKPSDVSTPVSILDVTSPIIKLETEDEDTKSVTEVSAENDTDETPEDSDDKKQKEREKKNKEAAIRYAQLKDCVMPWFYEQLRKYSPEEQASIKTCAESFGEKGSIIEPAIAISDDNLYTQNQIIEFCSVFNYFGRFNDDSAHFVKTIFAKTFEKTVEGTISKKIKGKDTIQTLLDDYWETKKKEK